MHSILPFAVAITLAVASPSFAASPPSVVSLLTAAPAGDRIATAKEGVDYRFIKPSQRNDAPAGQVEVVEFFGYWCPHCNEFESTMNTWTKANAGKVRVVKVPVAFRAGQANLMRLFYTLEAMGIEQQYRSRVFAQIHDTKTLSQQPGVGELVVWAQQNGIDREQFSAAVNSFGVEAKINAAKRMAAEYGIDGVPQLAIAGGVLLIPDAARMPLADAFVAKALAKK